MSADNVSLLIYIKEMIADLIYMNGIIATELTKITENLAAIRHGEDFLQKSRCLPEHASINQSIIDLVKKYKQLPKDQEMIHHLEKHVLKHDES
ncbi:MAG: hypothetical protein BAJALOKI1v1_170022 [Promethearchaeota archaeon]|nr:MAG: hypothetical protein BAJALOKI1v1_170022 [Candidatus Lokiarchaeota archaeon]